MCCERIDVNTITCPHLKGSKNEAMYDVVKDYVRNIEEVNIRSCMSRRFEICHVYRCDVKHNNIGFTEYAMLTE